MLVKDLEENEARSDSAGEVQQQFNRPTNLETDCARSGVIVMSFIREDRQPQTTEPLGIRCFQLPVVTGFSIDFPNTINICRI
jgi:hypothetical protein